MLTLDTGKQIEEFEYGWPEGFIGKISKTVEIFDVTKRHVEVGDTRVFDTTLIFSRVMIGLLANGHELDIKHILDHELAPVPTSLFTENCQSHVYINMGISMQSDDTNVFVLLLHYYSEQKLKI